MTECSRDTWADLLLGDRELSSASSKPILWLSGSLQHLYPTFYSSPHHSGAQLHHGLRALHSLPNVFPIFPSVGIFNFILKSTCQGTHTHRKFTSYAQFLSKTQQQQGEKGKKIRMRKTWAINGRPNQSSVNMKLHNRPKKATRMDAWFEDNCSEWPFPLFLSGMYPKATRRKGNKSVNSILRET